MTWGNEVGYRAAYAWTRAALEDIPKLKCTTWEVMPPPEDFAKAGSTTIAPVELPAALSATNTMPGAASPAGVRLHMSCCRRKSCLGGATGGKECTAHGVPPGPKHPRFCQGTQGLAKVPPLGIGSLHQAFGVCRVAQAAVFLKGKGACSRGAPA